MGAKCPECKKDDQIQKLSSIISAGTSSGTFSGPTASVSRVGDQWGTSVGSATLSGSTMTELARLISPPGKPGGVGCLFAPLILVGVSCMWWGLMDTSPEDLLFGLAFGGGLLYLAHRIRESHKRKVAVYQRSIEKGSPTFFRSYYCFRDDICFDPKTGKTWHPEHTKALFKA